MNLKKELEHYTMDSYTEKLLLKLIDKDCIVLVAEDLSGKDDYNFIYVDGKEKNFGKPKRNLGDIRISVCLTKYKGDWSNLV